MGRRDFRHLTTTCSKGINQQAELVDSGEVADARNMWAPNGRARSRPGFSGELGLSGSIAGAVIMADCVVIQEDTPTGTPSYTYHTAVPSNVVFVNESNWYYATSTNPNAAGSVWTRIITEMTVSNTENNYATFHYYNGTEWKPLTVAEWGGNSDSTTYFTTHMGPVSSGTRYTYFSFVTPADWAVSTVGTQVGKYMIRMKVHGSGDMDSIRFDDIGTTRVLTGANTVTEIMRNVRFSDIDRFIVSIRDSAGSLASAIVASGTNLNWFLERSFNPGRTKGHTSIAVIPQFDEAFVSYGQVTIRLTAYPQATDDIYAKVEDSVDIVGPKQKYDPDYVVQASAWPESDLITFFKGRLWSARGNTVRWSAPAPAHKVWPELSQEPVIEDDNSDITGLVGFGEHVVVFKRESIYIMPFSGQNNFALDEFSLVRVVSGVGCIAPDSIQKIRGRLVFLGEGGIYAFDGTPNIVKITEKRYQNINGESETGDRLSDFFATLNPGNAKFSSSAHWAKNRCYLVSVPVADSVDNDHTVVWDYANNALWIWDGFIASKWMNGDSSTEDEELFFADNQANIYRFGYGNNDHYAAISSSLTTHRFGYRKSPDKKRFRQVDVTSTNQARAVTVDVIPQENEPSKTSGTLDFSDPNEVNWDDTITDTETNWNLRQKIAKRIGFRVDASYAQVKLSHSEKDQPFEVTLVDVGYLPLGDR